MTLVQTATRARKLIAIFATLFAFYLLLVLLRPVASGIYLALFPPSDLPNTLFGMLDPLEFTEKQISNTSATPRFELNTTDGRLPSNLPNRMLVYRIRQPQFSYQGGTDAERHAESLGFTQDTLVSDLRGSEYVWRNRIKQTQLTIDTISRSVALRAELSGKELNYVARNRNEPNDINKAKSILGSLQRLNDTLYINGSQTVHYGRIVNGRLVVPSNLNETQVARVDFFRALNNYPILGPNPAQGLLNVTFGDIQPTARDVTSEVIEINYNQSEIIPRTESGDAIYPIISVADAWNAVSREGKGIISNITPSGANPFEMYAPVRVDQISIEEISLAYYETQRVQRFLQPIYVFKGKYTVAGRPGGEITIYFPAVDGNYVNAPIPEQQQPEGL